MNEMTNRRGAMSAAILGLAAVATHSHDTGKTQDSKEDCFTIEKVVDIGGRKQLALRIIAADDFQPVSGISVFLTHVGQGADGGGQGETTDHDGVARIDVWPGPWQVILYPPAGTRYCRTEFSKIENMLTVQSDGRCFPTQFRIAVHQTEWREMRDHVRESCSESVIES